MGNPYQPNDEDEDTDPEVEVIIPRRGGVLPRPNRKALEKSGKGVVDDILDQGKRALGVFGKLMSDDKAVDNFLDEVDRKLK